MEQKKAMVKSIVTRYFLFGPCREDTTRRLHCRGETSLCAARGPLRPPGCGRGGPFGRCLAAAGSTGVRFYPAAVELLGNGFDKTFKRQWLRRHSRRFSAGYSPRAFELPERQQVFVDDQRKL